MSLFKIFILGCLLSVSQWMVSSSYAQSVERLSYDRQLMSRKPSTNDEVGLAFLKTANHFPDFNKIVEMSATYKSLDPLAQKDFQARMVSKYQAGYLQFSPRKSDLIFRLTVNTMFKKNKDGTSVLKVKTLAQDPFYLPFYFGGYPIALIPKGIEEFKELHLDKIETDIVYSRLALNGNATLLLQVYPIVADDEKTIMFDNIPQYPMLADIAYIGFLNKRGEQIWAWRHEKYVQKNNRLGGVKSSTEPLPLKSGDGK